MGIFRKIWKGVKKVFKKVGKGIKKVVKKVGKFMDKLGIVGQIGMMFVLPVIGEALMGGLSAWGATLAGKASLFARGAGAVLNTAHKFATTVGNVYRTVTGAVTDFIGTAGKYIGGKMELKGFQDMTLGEAWKTYTSEVMKNVTSIVDPWKRAVTINPSFGSTVADQAKAVGMSPEQFVEAYTMPENVTASLKGLSGDELANFRFDSVQTQTFKPGQAPGVTASVVAPITEPFQATRNTDFWGFAPEVRGAWIPDPNNPGQLIQTGQAPGVGKGIIPAPTVEVAPVEVEAGSLMGPPVPERLDPTFMGPTRDPSYVPDSSVTASQAAVIDPLEKGWLRRAGEEAVTGVPTQLLTQAVSTWAAGDPPRPEEVTYGGTDYWAPSSQVFAEAIRATPLYSPHMSSLMGTNTDPDGTVGAIGPSVYRSWMG